MNQSLQVKSSQDIEVVCQICGSETFFPPAVESGRLAVRHPSAMGLYEIHVKPHKMAYFSLPTRLAPVLPNVRMFGRPWVCPGSGQTEARGKSQLASEQVQGLRTATAPATLCHSATVMEDSGGEQVAETDLEPAQDVTRELGEEQEDCRLPSPTILVSFISDMQV